MMYRIHDNGTDRDATPDEIIELENRANQPDLVQQQIDAQKAARVAVLAKLGLTADEATALLG